GDVPEPHGRVLTAGGQSLAVWAECETMHFTAMHREGAEVLARGCVPQLRRSVEAHRGQRLPIRGKLDPDDVGGVSGERSALVSGGNLPQFDRPVPAGGRQGLAVWAERDAEHRPVMPRQRAPQLTVG